MKQVAIMIESLTSMILFITVSYMLKSMRVVLLPYLALKSPFKMTISMYYMIYQRDIYTDT